MEEIEAADAKAAQEVEEKKAADEARIAAEQKAANE